MVQRLFVFLIIASFCISPSFASENDPVLAKAGDLIFRQSDYDRLMSYSPHALQKQLQENPEQRVILIERVMQNKIIAGAARKEGFEKKEDIREQTQYLTDDFLATEYLKKVFADEKKNITLKEDELRQYYAANTNLFTIPEQVKARHIVIKVPKDASEEKRTEVKDRAKEIHRKLKQGEDFEKLAEQYSEDPASKSKRGDLGYILRGQTEKPFEDAAFSLKPGEFSYVVETSQGYHLIFSEAHIKERVKTFDEVREFIDSQVKERLAQERIRDFMKKVTTASGLEIDKDKILGKVSKEDQK
jgi:peptidyl-prolyl cis-trans isomerase C